MGGTLCAQDAESVFGQKRVAIKSCAKEHARLEANFAFKPAIAKAIILTDARRGFKAKVAFDRAIVKTHNCVHGGGTGRLEQKLSKHLAWIARGTKSARVEAHSATQPVGTKAQQTDGFSSAEEGREVERVGDKDSAPKELGPAEVEMVHIEGYRMERRERFAERARSWARSCTILLLGDGQIGGTEAGTAAEEGGKRWVGRGTGRRKVETSEDCLSKQQPRLHFSRCKAPHGSGFVLQPLALLPFTDAWWHICGGAVTVAA